MLYTSIRRQDPNYYPDSDTRGLSTFFLLCLRWWGRLSREEIQNTNLTNSDTVIPVSDVKIQITTLILIRGACLPFFCYFCPSHPIHPRCKLDPNYYPDSDTRGPVYLFSVISAMVRQAIEYPDPINISPHAAPTQTQTLFVFLLLSFQPIRTRD